MGATWNHPNLGQFEYDGMAWVRTIDVPEFKAFSYNTGYANALRSTGKHELSFDADDNSDVPSAEAITLASTVLTNQAELVTKVAKALWDDFNGRGPSSGMWWHGNLEEVTENMDTANAPACPNDVLGLLRVSQIGIRKGVHGYDKPVVEFAFNAAFEREHGVGVLTDGKAVLGIGYMVSVTPFKMQ